MQTNIYIIYSCKNLNQTRRVKMYILILFLFCALQLFILEHFGYKIHTILFESLVQNIFNQKFQLWIIVDKTSSFYNVYILCVRAHTHTHTHTFSWTNYDGNDEDKTLHFLMVSYWKLRKRNLNWAMYLLRRFRTFSKGEKSMLTCDLMYSYNLNSSAAMT